MAKYPDGFQERPGKDDRAVAETEDLLDANAANSLQNQDLKVKVAPESVARTEEQGAGIETDKGVRFELRTKREVVQAQEVV